MPDLKLFFLRILLDRVSHIVILYVLLLIYKIHVICMSDCMVPCCILFVHGVTIFYINKDCITY